MNRNWIWALGLSIIVMLSLVVVNNNPREAIDDEVGRLLLPGLQASLSAVDKVLIKGIGGETTLLITEGSWGIVERYQFDADVGKLSGFLKSLANSKLIERKTRKPVNFERLGVDSGGADTLEVQIFAGDDSYSLLIGDTVSNRTGQYIRFYEHESDADQVWLSNVELDASADPSYWLDKEVIDIDSDRVMQISMQQGTELLEIVRQEGELQILNLPEESELKYPGIVDSLARALADVRMLEVRLATEVDFSKASDAVFNLEDDVKIRIRVIAEQDRYWLQLVDHEKSRWAFEISERVFENLTKGIGDLLKAEQEVS